MKNKIKNIILLLMTLIIVFSIVELSCFLLLKYSKDLNYSYPYFNQQISPYYVFKNTPGFRYRNAIKSRPDEPDAIVDEYGFISEAPISKHKDTNTLRIFITGGSGAFGSGQMSPYDLIKPYPGGFYSFESSIAGQLQKILKKEYPNKVIEVVNACSVKRMLHHSVAYYLETISDFNPNFVVSLDGNNDIAPMCGISPYFKGSLDFSTYIELYEIEQANLNKSYLNIVNLINTLKIYNFENKDKSSQENDMDYFRYSFNSSTYKDYCYFKKIFVRNSEKFIKLIEYYHSICEVDNVKFIFCLQPLLYREKINKSLSVYERKMQSNFFSGNSKTMDTKNKFSPSQIELIMRGMNLIQKYFIDDYLTEKIRQVSDKDGFSYIDMNKEIVNIPSSTDIFVDYCHLTPVGNKIVAEIISRKIKTLLTGQQKDAKFHN